MSLPSNRLAEIIAPVDAQRAAVGAPARKPMNYADLQALIAATAADLRSAGVNSTDRVGIVLPNGPAMATCFVSVAAAAGAAPLNPAYREPEFEFYLDDLGPRALIVAAGEAGPARDVATRMGIRVIELEEPQDAAAGSFRLDYAAAEVVGSGVSRADDIALVLHTSGTTSRPKIVPLTQANLCASAQHIRSTLALTPEDVCLNVMPLFHIHGLIAAVLSSLAAGAQVVCSPGFSATAFFGWMAACSPSWYTAVPTMHQVILDRAKRNAEVIERSALRFIRSSSASLPAPVMGALEETFGCPVIESYGMTEAAHQMTSNPLPPAARKAGSVGRPAGPEVRLLDTEGRPVPAGVQGEIVIRGPNVTGGYANNEKANAEAFVDDFDDGTAWFRTGDLGVFDEEGYLTIDGRIKEIINRGGEKISPREVDEVLLQHDGVKQVVTFAMPHEKLGEDVAVAVVLETGSDVGDAALRDFAAAQLAAFKVPRRFVFVEEIPKGPTGKLQRIGLAEKLGLA